MSDILQIRHQFKIENAVKEDNNLVISGMAAHYNVRNLNDEIVNADSFNEFFSLYNDGKLTPALNYNHTDTIIGGIDLIESREEGLWLQAHLNGNVAICRDMIIPCILGNELKSFSTEGFIRGGVDGVDFNDDGSYYVRNFMLTAVAVVSTPADADATFTVKNYLDVNGLNPKTSNALTDKEKGDKSAVLLLL